MIGAGSMHVLGLHRCCRRVSLVHSSLFCCGWSSGNSTLAAVIADMVNRGFVDHGLLVNVGDVRGVHITHRAVVEEVSVIPITAAVTDAAITEAVVDAAIVADTLPPVAFIPGKSVAAPTPISWSPEQAHGGRFDPSTRHPEIAFIPICPVTGRPQIAGGRNHRLCVHRKRGRSDHDGHAKLRERDGRYGQY